MRLRSGMMHVIGTAGHVDHGKSSLVEALTGIDPDRLREEKEREMTIVLGFAWLTLPNGESVGIVDVPGHKDFVKNMLAGVGGIDAVLLVIAADEGIMPQTREHLDILNLLQVNGGVIALTKADLVDDPEWLELVAADVMEQVEGTPLENAPIVPVSARTGEGLDELVAEIQACLGDIPERADRGRPRLPIDRVFTVAGFGTVVTGTLTDGTLRVGQEVELVPSGRRARIRGLQTHMAKIDEAVPGSRVAVNLAGVDRDEVLTGQVVTLPGWLRPTVLVDVQLHYLADAPQPLRHNTEVDFFSGTTEVPARVRLLGVETLPPGGTGWAQLRLSRPVALVRGDRFIVRWLSPSVTVGGGVVVDPSPGRRHRRFRPELIERLETLAHGTPEEIVLQALEAAQPCEARELVRRLTLPLGVVEDALNGLLAGGQVFVLDDLEGTLTHLDRPDTSGRFLLSAFGWQEIVERMRVALGAYHRAHPLRRGMPREELRSRLQERLPHLGGRLFNQVVALAAHRGFVDQDETGVWLADHVVRLSPEQQAAMDTLLQRLVRSQYASPSAAECIGQVGEDVYAAMVEGGVLVPLNEDVVYLSETVAEMRQLVVDHIRREGSATIAEVRDLLGASRKYALALMEYLDEQRITRRVGDTRVLHARADAALRTDAASDAQDGG
jgi:selenocysteine-specific elongation factor